MGSSERNAALRKRLKDLKADRDALQAKHEELDRQRTEYLEIIQNADTFRKYKALQRELADTDAALMPCASAGSTIGLVNLNVAVG